MCQWQLNRASGGQSQPIKTDGLKLLIKGGTEEISQQHKHEHLITVPSTHEKTTLGALAGNSIAAQLKQNGKFQTQ